MNEPVRLIDLTYAAFESGSPSESSTAFDPATICPCREHHRFWRSRHGHLICAGCHPPARPGIVAEFVDVGPRPVPTIVLQSIDRSRRTLHTINLNLKPASHRRSKRR